MTIRLIGLLLCGALLMLTATTKGFAGNPISGVGVSNEQVGMKKRTEKNTNTVPRATKTNKKTN